MAAADIIGHQFHTADGRISCRECLRFETYPGEFGRINGRAFCAVCQHILSTYAARHAKRGTTDPTNPFCKGAAMTTETETIETVTAAPVPAAPLTSAQPAPKPTSKTPRKRAAAKTDLKAVTAPAKPAPATKAQIAKAAKAAPAAGVTAKRGALSDAQIAEIKTRAAAGESQKAIAAHFGVAYTTVHKHCDGLTSRKPAAAKTAEPMAAQV